MTDHSNLAAALSLDRSGGIPLALQLYRQFRSLILSGRLPPGRRLPATRPLAAELGIARSTARGSRVPVSTTVRRTT